MWDRKGKWNTSDDLGRSNNDNQDQQQPQPEQSEGE